MRSGWKLMLAKRSDFRKVTLAWWVLAFSIATFRASSEMSEAKILASLSFFARVMAIQPEPVPMSRMVGLFGSILLAGLTPGR